MLAVALYTAVAVGLGQALQHALRQSGFPDAKVQPVLVGWNFVRTQDVRLDQAGMNRIRRVEARFTPRSLIARRVRSLELDGVRLEIRPFGGGPVFPGFVPNPTGGETAPGPLPADRIVLADIAVIVATPSGPVLLASSGAPVAQSTTGITVDMPVRVEHGPMSAGGRFQARIGDAGTIAELRLDRATLSDDGRRLAPFAADIEAKIAEGGITVAANAGGVFQTEGGPIRFDFRGAHTADNNTVEFALAGTGAHLSGRIRAARDHTGTPNVDGSVSVRGFDPAAFGGAQGRLNADVQARGSISGRLAKVQVTGSLNGVFGGAVVQQGQFRGPLNVSITSGEFSVAAPDCVTLNLLGISAGSLRQGRLSFVCAKSEPEEALLSVIHRANGTALLASKGQVGQASGSWPSQAPAEHRTVAMDNLHWELTRRDGLTAGALRGRLSDGAPATWFAPIDIAAELRSQIPGQVAIRLNGSQGRGLIDFTSNLQLGPAGIGGGGLRLGPLRIPPGTGVQWKQRTLPGVPGLEALAGNIEALGDGEWDRGGVRSRGRVQIHRGEVAAFGAKASGIELDLAASSLWPVLLPIPQPVKIERLEAGIILQNLAFTVSAPSRDRVEIGHGQAAFAGGTLAIQPFAIHVPDRTAETVITASGLQVAEVLKLVGIDGLSGSGAVSGHIPVQVTGSTVKVTEGVLESNDGVLAYAPDSPPKAFAQAQAKLALQALRNFHYDALTLTLDGVSGDDSRAILALNGHNPDFYNGKSVKFTLNLSGALDTILKRGISAYTLPTRVRSQIEQMQHNPR